MNKEIKVIDKTVADVL